MLNARKLTLLLAVVGMLAVARFARTEADPGAVSVVVYHRSKCSPAWFALPASDSLSVGGDRLSVETVDLDSTAGRIRARLFADGTRGVVLRDEEGSPAFATELLLEDELVALVQHFTQHGGLVRDVRVAAESSAGEPGPLWEAYYAEKALGNKRLAESALRRAKAADPDLRAPEAEVFRISLCLRTVLASDSTAMRESLECLAPLEPTTKSAAGRRKLSNILATLYFQVGDADAGARWLRVAWETRQPWEYASRAHRLLRAAGDRVDVLEPELLRELQDATVGGSSVVPSESR